VNLEAPPGTKRPRKRGRGEEDEEEEPENPRRRRQSYAGNDDSPGGPEEQDELDEYPPIPRFAHNHALAQSSAPQTSSASTSRLRTSPPDSLAEGLPPPPRTSDNIVLPRLRAVREEDYESDDETSILEPQYQVPPWKTPTPPYSSPNGTSQLGDDGGESHVVERMRAEIDSLRRQSAAMLTEKQRLADQLDDARAEALQARVDQRAAEKLLKEEENLRRDEEKLRREAEVMVRDLQQKLHEYRMSR
jgi:hypothetical protein